MNGPIGWIAAAEIIAVEYPAYSPERDRVINIVARVLGMDASELDAFCARVYVRGNQIATGGK